MNENQKPSSDFWLVSENHDTYIHVTEGTGQNLLDEDEAEGYVDYIYYTIFDSLTDINNDEESDGGQIMLKELYVFALLLLIFSYLVPKEEYKSYIQFFIGIFMIVIILKPVLTIITADEPAALYEIFDGFNERLEQMEMDDWRANETEDIYELFIFKGEGE